MVLLARAPRAGRVKRRLASDLGGPAALALHRAFVIDTLRWMRGAARRGWEPRVEWSAPFHPDPPMARALGSVRTGLQARGHLGVRIGVALRRALRAGAPSAVAIGGDAPHLGPGALDLALRRLERAEVVLGPAEDGGYYLIGARRAPRSWFEGIPWGTARVLRQTLARLRRDRVRVALLAPGYDLDTAESVWRLARALTGSRRLRRLLPSTRRALLRLQLGAADQWRSQR